MAPAHAEFYLHKLDRLPSTFDDHAVTLDLSGEIAVRAKTVDVERPTELILTNSCRTGDDVRISSDRRFLARAAAIGLGTILLYGPSDKLVAQDASRQYLWMPLAPEGAIPPSENCLRIESPRGAPATAPVPFLQPPNL